MVDLAGLVPIRRPWPGVRWLSSRPETPSRTSGGARATAAALTGLDAARWVVHPGPGALDDVGVRVDHLVVGPPGVLVVGSRSWSGTARSAHGVLRQDGARRERDLAEAAASAAAVRAHHGLDDDVPVIGVLCFVPPAMVTGWIGEVLLCATGDVVAVLDRLAQRLDAEQVGELAARLAPVPAAEPADPPAEPVSDLLPVLPEVAQVVPQTGA